MTKYLSIIVLMLISCSTANFTKMKNGSISSEEVIVEPESIITENNLSLNNSPIIDKISLVETTGSDGKLKLIFDIKATDPENDEITCNVVVKEPSPSEESIKMVESYSNGCISLFSVLKGGNYVFLISVKDNRGGESLGQKNLFIGSIETIFNSIPDLKIIEPQDGSSFVRGSIATFKFTLFDEGVDLCTPLFFCALIGCKDEQGVQGSGVKISVYDSFSTDAYKITLDGDCAAKITLPDVISSFPITFKYEDPLGLYSTAAVNITTMENTVKKGGD